jgi:hypothetical protein
MITFQLEDRAAETMLAILNATAGHASFLDALNEQLEAQMKPVATPVVEEVIEETPAKKTKAKVEE